MIDAVRQADIVLPDEPVESPYAIPSLNVLVDDQTPPETRQAWQGEGG